ncbi:MAG TPA: mechanosensitive ion channel domain-containing protein [Ktedonobacteraceae bacterium]|nr:mechanosensitive ion channel domain-containing protein [Ktedonobacteraceae bacterium]
MSITSITRLVSFFVGSNSATLGLANIVTMTLNIVLSIIIPLVALGVGLVLRRLLVRRLKNTFLDNWIVQTLGVIVVVPLFVMGVIAVIGIWSLDPFILLWDQFLRTTGNNPTTLLTSIGGPLWNIIETLLLISLGIGIARTVRALTVRGLGESRIDINIRTLTGRIFHFLILVIVGFWVLSIWNVPLTTPVAAVGLITVAVTVAIQDILKNLVAGFYILFERPFYIGNEISINTGTVTYTGKVEDVQPRTTKLRLLTGEDVIIPNAIIFSGSVVNNSYYGERRATITAILPEEDFIKDETIPQILQALKNIDSVTHTPESTVVFSGYSEHKITLIVRFWVATGQHQAISDVMYTLHTILPNATLTVQESAGNI